MGARNVGGDATNLSAIRWLTISSKGNTKISVTAPSLRPDEIAVKLELKVPRALFTRPALQAQIVIAADKAPTIITAAVKDNIAEIVRQQTGLSITLVEPKD